MNAPYRLICMYTHTGSIQVVRKVGLYITEKGRKMAEAQRIKIKKSGKTNLTTQAYNIIKNSICENSIEAGALISESQLAESFGMSRTPIREALKLLENEGLVEIRTGIGAIVKDLTTKQIKDLYEVRRLIETAAAKSAINFFPQEEIADIRERIMTLKGKAVNGALSRLEFTELDLLLHNKIVEYCENTYLKSIMGEIMYDVKRVQLVSFNALNSIEESTKQHLRILDLLEEKDEEKFVRAISDHIDWASGCIFK